MNGKKKKEQSTHLPLCIPHIYNSGRGKKSLPFPSHPPLIPIIQKKLPTRYAHQPPLPSAHQTPRPIPPFPQNSSPPIHPPRQRILHPLHPPPRLNPRNHLPLNHRQRHRSIKPRIPRCFHVIAYQPAMAFGDLYIPHHTTPISLLSLSLSRGGALSLLSPLPSSLSPPSHPHSP